MIIYYTNYKKLPTHINNHLYEILLTIISPITSMDIGQMFITIVVVIVCDHFLWLAFEAHAFVASTASYSVAAVCTHYWHFAALVWAFSDAVLFHVFLECGVASLFGLLTS